MYAQAFFDLQLRFADSVASLTGLPLPRVLLDYTNLYIRFGLGRDFDAAHPVWREYLAGLDDTGDRRGWTYRFYLARGETTGAPAVVASFGCFSYAVSDGRIRLHFQNVETDGRSPLGLDRLGHRRADLAALFAHVKRTRPGPLRVVGTSWLYNLHAYRRLFPASYVETARPVAGRFRHMPLWGQFLDRHGEVKASPRDEFLERLARQSNAGDLDECFPLRVLAVEAPVQAFY